MKWSSLYGEWGKLLYAVAACDGSVSESERQELNNTVSNALANFQLTDEFGSPVPTYLYAGFEFAEEELCEREDLLASYLQFIERHRTALTNEIIQKMIDSATHIADAYYGISKRENRLLSEIKQSLGKMVQENHFTKTTSS